MNIQGVNIPSTFKFIDSGNQNRTHLCKNNQF